MNALDLPPRRQLPGETRDRIRRSIDTGLAAPRRRLRAPLAAAAAVTVLALGAVAVATWAPGTDRPAAPNDPAAPITMTLPDRRTQEDLDHCADVAAASTRAGEFAPRAEWLPKFTATTRDGTRITAFVGKSGDPAFCEVTDTTATVSDPGAGWATIAVTPDYMPPASVYAVYLSPSGVLAGIAHGVDALEFSVLRDLDIVPVTTPAFRDGMFVVPLGEFGDGDVVDVIGRDSQGMRVVSGNLAHDPEELPPPGLTGPIR
ncbi:hypothetical protein [Actinophytocola sp. KF-1]